MNGNDQKETLPLKLTLPRHFFSIDHSDQEWTHCFCGSLSRPHLLRPAGSGGSFEELLLDMVLQYLMDIRCRAMSKMLLFFSSLRSALEGDVILFESRYSVLNIRSGGWEPQRVKSLEIDFTVTVEVRLYSESGSGFELGSPRPSENPSQTLKCVIHDVRQSRE